MKAFTGLHAYTENKSLNKSLYRLSWLDKKTKGKHLKNKKPLQAYMPILKTKETNPNESLYRLTCLHGKQRKNDARCWGGDCKQNVVDNKNVLTHVLVNISTSSLQLSHLTFFLIWLAIVFLIIVTSLVNAILSSIITFH